MRPVRSDAEKIARNRVLMASLIIYLLCMGFMILADALIGSRGGNLAYARLAVLPLFVLLLRWWLRVVRVRPPEELLQGRKLAAQGRHEAAREQLDQVDAGSAHARKVDRARRMLQDGMAVTVADEVDLERGRLSLLMGDNATAAAALLEVSERLPHRAEIAIDLADALCRCGKDKEAAQALRGSLKWMDPVDLRTLRGQPSLMRLLGESPLPSRSAMAPRIWRERAVTVLLLAGAVCHAAWLYLL